MIQIIQYENFEYTLFANFAQIFPKLNVRDFSAWLGKSPGYWSSITSQGLHVSTSALKNLNDYIECRKTLLPEEDALYIRLAKIQELITKEIVERFMIETESFDDIEEEVLRTIAEKEKVGEVNYDALPFLFSRYR